MRPELWLLAALPACLAPEPHAIVTIDDPEGHASGATSVHVGTTLDTLEPLDLDGALPISVVVTRGATGAATIWVEARAAGGIVLGRGVTGVAFVRRDAPTSVLLLRRPCTSDPDCDDGLHCTGIELCAGTMCEPGIDPCAPSHACI